MTRSLFVLAGLTLLPLAAAYAGAGKEQITLTVLYDNTVAHAGVQSDWGFACLVEGTASTVLFDTGTEGSILSHNAEALGVDLAKVEVVVLSHEHRDHTGGLERVLRTNPKVVVYHPASFSGKFIDWLDRSGARAVAVDEPVTIGPDLFLTGQLGSAIKEQALIVKTADGLVVVTGCSHPGIVAIVARTSALHAEPIDAVVGGFHLMQHSDAATRQVIARLRELGVRRCGPCHCTGERQIELFRQAFGEAFVPMGVGRVLRFQSIR